MKKNLIKIVGILAGIIGIAASIASDWAKEEAINRQIEEKVNEALAKKEKSPNKDSFLFFRRMS